MKRKENDLNQTSMIMFHVHIQGCSHLFLLNGTFKSFPPFLLQKKSLKATAHLSNAPLKINGWNPKNYPCHWKGKWSRWWFQTFFIFTPTGGNDPIWLKTTNMRIIFHPPMSIPRHWKPPCRVEPPLPLRIVSLQSKVARFFLPRNLGGSVKKRWREIFVEMFGFKESWLMAEFFFWVDRRWYRKIHERSVSF